MIIRFISMMKLMIENMFRVDLLIISFSIIFMMVSGSEDMMVMGCKKLLNCEVSIR